MMKRLSSGAAAELADGSKIVGLQPSVFCNASEHLRADLFLFMERENEVGPTITLKHPMRAGPSLLDPADSSQGGQNSSRLCCRPVHPWMEKTPWTSGMSSPCSSLSARTRNARAFVRATASSREEPYASTPGSSGISPTQRPSVSRSISTVKSLMAESYNFGRRRVKFRRLTVQRSPAPTARAEV